MDFNIFDIYNLRARIFVCILYAAPFAFDFIYLGHFSLSTNWAFSILLVVTCQLLLNTPRPQRKSQSSNAARDLLLPSSELSSGTRERFYRKLSSLEPEFYCFQNYLDTQKFPDGKSAEEACSDVIIWLRAKTRNRDQYHLILEENINYGFIRNMVNLRFWGIRFNLISAVVFFLLCLFSTYVIPGKWDHQYFIFPALVHTLVFLYLKFCIDNSSEYAAAKRYAYALLEAIDTL